MSLDQTSNIYITNAAEPIKLVPYDIWRYLGRIISRIDVLNCRAVSHQWNKVFSDQKIWENILKDYHFIKKYDFSLHTKTLLLFLKDQKIRKNIKQGKCQGKTLLTLSAVKTLCLDSQAQLKTLTPWHNNFVACFSDGTTVSLEDMTDTMERGHLESFKVLYWPKDEVSDIAILNDKLMASTHSGDIFELELNNKPKLIISHLGNINTLIKIQEKYLGAFIADESFFLITLDGKIEPKPQPNVSGILFNNFYGKTCSFNCSLPKCFDLTNQLICSTEINDRILAVYSNDNKSVKGFISDMWPSGSINTYHSEAITAIAVIDNHLITASNDNTVHSINITNAKSVCPSIKIPKDQIITQMIVHNEKVITGTSQGEITVWNFDF
ncbi:MAG: hypothetical protein JHC93_08625 [Parachlamydiales bacterium]|nr:hypothetical protein [Parachlamydiales bacterium]